MKLLILLYQNCPYFYNNSQNCPNCTDTQHVSLLLYLYKIDKMNV